MSVRPDPALLAREWVEKAEEDLTNAEHTLTMRERCPFSTVCFHAQQCAEKYIKALFVSISTDFPKTHDIRELCELLPAEVRPPVDLSERELLSAYAVPPRYPWDREPFTRAEAEKAVAIARAVREAARRDLPGDAVA